MLTRRGGLVAMLIGMFASIGKAEQDASGTTYTVRSVTDFGLALPAETTVTFTIGTESVKLTAKEILEALKHK
jgi:hypothetical protein